MNRRTALSLALGCLLALAGSAYGQGAVERIPGDVVTLNGRSLAIRIGGGAVVTMALTADVRVSARSAADWGMVAPGAYIGTTAAPRPDGTLAAVEVHVFPEAMRGTGEGHRPMSTGVGNTMTNATVTSVSASGLDAPGNTMTNATVAGIAAAGNERRITLRYKDGEKVVAVGDTVPIVLVEPGDLSMLVPGVHVLVTATRAADGTLTADRVSVGKNGLVPPI